MKKLGILIASAFLVGMTFTSCSSDDDSSSNNELLGSVVGKWNFSTEKYYENGVLVQEGPYSENAPGCSPDYLELFENETAINGDYSNDNSQCTLITYPSMYTRSENTLLVTEDGDVSIIQIVEVTSTKLVLKSNDTYNGMAVSAELTFTKAQ